MEPQYDYGACFYDQFAVGLTGDVEFYREEAVAAGGPVLELGCGTGRILIPIAEAGINIIGLDLSPGMLAKASAKLARCSTEARARVRLVEGDMRSFSFDELFQLIMVPYSVLLHLLTPEDQRQALCCIHDHLVAGGRLVLNIGDPIRDIYGNEPIWQRGPLFRAPEMITLDNGNRAVFWVSYHYDAIRQVVEQMHIFEEIDADNRLVSKTFVPISLRYLFRYEMQYLLELCGFRIEALYGDFHRAPFRSGCEQIWIASRT